MAQVRQGPIERWSGKLLRWIMAYLFLMGFLLGLFVIGVVLWTVAQAPDEILNVQMWSFVGNMGLYAVLLVAPYLAIRYRDPESTTLPRI